jgi:coenzyme F420-dependent glucose-6-phosphate dehydrogenase
VARIGYTLSSEELPPNELVRCAQRAEEVGFDFAMISDHFHPWVSEQGQSPFVWATLGGIAQATERIRVGTGVTCPTIRIHPAIVAHAAATVATMMDGRFFLGVGAGENLNEHILGDRWPQTGVRQEMLEEAVAVIRMLWEGGMKSHRGRHYTVENARLYTLPDEPPEIMVAAGGERATDLAGRIGDGFIGLVPKAEVIQQFRRAGGEGKPTFGQVHVCWAEDEDEARRTARRQWPNAGVPGSVNWELPLPSAFESLAEQYDEDDIAASVICGPDADRFVAAVGEFVDAGYDHVYLHQVGSDQDAFLDFSERELLPLLREAKIAVAGAG